MKSTPVTKSSPSKSEVAYSGKDWTMPLMKQGRKWSVKSTGSTDPLSSKSASQALPCASAGLLEVAGRQWF